MMEWELDEVEASAAGGRGPESLAQISSKAFNVIFLSALTLLLGGLAVLCAKYHVTRLEQTLEAPAEIP
jgi:hypothetical protein